MKLKVIDSEAILDHLDHELQPSTGDNTVVRLDTTAQANFIKCYVYETNLGYQYTMLAWLMGSDGALGNPSCVKVNVKRVFI